MDAVLLIGVFLIIAVCGLLLFSVFSSRSSQPPETLVPFSVVPVHNGSPSTKAFLELFAGQIAWMDSSILQSVVLMYPDGDLETADLCREIAQQYDFFTCMSLSETQSLLKARMEITEDDEKKSESSCNLSENTV